MSHTKLRTINKLAVADRLKLSEDDRLFCVVAIDSPTGDGDGRRKVDLQSVDGATHIMLVRQGRELVRVMVEG